MEFLNIIKKFLKDMYDDFVYADWNAGLGRGNYCNYGYGSVKW